MQENRKRYSMPCIIYTNEQGVSLGNFENFLNIFFNGEKNYNTNSAKIQ